MVIINHAALLAGVFAEGGGLIEGTASYHIGIKQLLKTEDISLGITLTHGSPVYTLGIVKPPILHGTSHLPQV